MCKICIPLNEHVVSLEVNRETWQGGKRRVWLYNGTENLKSLGHRVTTYTQRHLSNNTVSSDHVTLCVRMKCVYTIIFSFSHKHTMVSNVTHTMESHVSRTLW